MGAGTSKASSAGSQHVFARYTTFQTSIGLSTNLLQRNTDAILTIPHRQPTSLLRGPSPLISPILELTSISRLTAPEPNPSNSTSKSASPKNSPASKNARNNSSPISNRRYPLSPPLRHPLPPLQTLALPRRSQRYSRVVPRKTIGRILGERRF
jgi:hypothetical protein